MSTNVNTTFNCRETDLSHFIPPKQIDNTILESKIIELSKNILKNVNVETNIQELKTIVLQGQGNKNERKVKQILKLHGFKTEEMRKIVGDVFYEGKQPWSYGNALTREEAETMLKKAPNGSWLLRFSHTKKEFVVTKKEENSFIHYSLNEKDLSKLKQTLFANYPFDLMLLDNEFLDDSAITFGTMSSEEAIAHLNHAAPVGAVLLRYSESKDKLFFTAKVKERSYTHIPIEKYQERGVYTYQQLWQETQQRTELSGLNNVIIWANHNRREFARCSRKTTIEKYLAEQQKELQQLSLPLRFYKLQKNSEVLPVTQKAISQFIDIHCPELTSLKVKDNVLHANYVKLAHSEFICAQAPLESTVEVFWKAVLQHTDFIMDLTNKNDYADIQFTNYYPEQVNSEFIKGSISIICMDKVNVDGRKDVSLSTYTVTDTSVNPLHKKTVYRLNYRGWPDQGVVGTDELKQIIEWFNRYKKVQTPLVHCRAGVGRTGTLCVGSTLQDKINDQSVNQNNYQEAIDQLILEGRYQRGEYFVQSIEQYQLLRTLAEKELRII